MIEIIEFKEKYIEEVANIFIGNYKKLKEQHKELPSKYEDLQVLIPMLIELMKNNPAVVAISNNKIIGYMSGKTNIQNFKGTPNGVYIPEWGHSVINDENKELIYHKMYKNLSGKWVNNKCYTHIITYYANDNILNNLLFNLCFGLLVIDGIRPINRIKSQNISGLIVRKAEEKDLLKIKELHKNINIHLSEPPIFLNTSNTDCSIEELKNEFLSDDVISLLGEKDGKIVSLIRGMINNGPNCRIAQDIGTLGIDFGYTDKDMQGKGIATIVLDELMKWGLENKMIRSTVDFESQNREGVNFWLRHFKPLCYSAMRKIDDRI